MIKINIWLTCKRNNVIEKSTEKHRKKQKGKSPELQRKIKEE